MIERIRKEFEEKRYLDTLMHALVAIFLSTVFSFMFPFYKKETIVFVVFLGSVLPDTDHLLLYKRHKFYSFKAFLRWIVHSSRYRMGFELFHNFPSIITIVILLPLIYFRNKIVFTFFVAFLFHLIADLIVDRIVLRSVRFWRFGI